MSTDLVKKSGTSQDVAQELKAKEIQMKQRLATLEQELSDLGPDLRKSILKHPAVSMGGALLAGLAVGLLFGGSKKPKDPFKKGVTHQALVDHYIDALVEEVRYKIVKGADASEAIREALADRAPLILYQTNDDSTKKTFLGSLIGMAFDNFLSIALIKGANRLFSGTSDGQKTE